MDTPPRPVRQGDLLREPITAEAAASNLTGFTDWLRRASTKDFSDYPALWQWSVDEPDAFWWAVARFFNVKFHRPPDNGVALASREMPGARWFPGATLNYAEHACRADDSTPAIIFQGEAGARRQEISRTELREQVHALAAALRMRGVRQGDRVAGYLPNLLEAVVAFLAAASLGAVWSNCPAELSPRGVIERFAQIEPTVLFAVASYTYGGKIHDRSAALEEILCGLPSLRFLVMVPGPASDEPSDKLRVTIAGVPSSLALQEWDGLLAHGRRAVQERDEADERTPPFFAPVPFDHPLWILYSSGTTGAPKAIVHSHGGVLLEHLKTLSLQLDLRGGDRFTWYTSAGWMMWNLLVSGLLLPGVTILLYDGSPKHPDLQALWDFVERERVTYFGTSAPFLAACMKERIVPASRGEFAALRTLGSTGAPLPPEGFGWVHANVKRDVLVGSMSGGTDVCTAFVLSSPTLPEHAGELQCLALGARIEAWDDEGRPHFGQVGELVLTAPYPSMPICLWNDPDGTRLRTSYYEKFPGVWSHGDWIEIGAPGVRCVIHGRSDATLNRGGVRMGTAEFYAVVEDVPEIAEALVVDTGGLGRGGALLLFVVMRAGAALDDTLRAGINARLRAGGSPRHIPDAIYAVPELPRTLNGKKLEVPVKRILTGLPLEKAVSREAVANPEALRYFVDLFNNL